MLSPCAVFPYPARKIASHRQGRSSRAIGEKDAFSGQPTERVVDYRVETHARR